MLNLFIYFFIVQNMLNLLIRLVVGTLICNSTRYQDHIYFIFLYVNVNLVQVFSAYTPNESSKILRKYQKLYFGTNTYQNLF